MNFNDPDPMHPIYNIGDNVYFFFNNVIYKDTIDNITVTVTASTISTKYRVKNAGLTYAEPELFASPEDLKQHLIREETDVINNYPIKDAF